MELVKSFRIDQKEIWGTMGGEVEYDEQGVPQEKEKKIECDVVISAPPEDLHQHIGSLSVREKAQKLAKLLDATDGLGGWLRLWKVFRSNPPELQFSCAIGLDTFEEMWHDLLKCESGDVSAIAAQVLWTRHSRRYARDVLNVLSGKENAAPEWEPVRRLVEDTLRSEHILLEIRADREWGLWLAALKPHPDLVPTLLAAHKIEQTGYTTFALGSSKDFRAFKPLIAQLKSGDYMKSGYAAQALGMLGMPDAEMHLIEVLDNLGAWAQAHACTALGKIGTEKAIPHLARQDTICAINVYGCAQRAIKQIKARQGKPQEQQPSQDK